MMNPSEVHIDVDEWRDDPLRHRYVHGEFLGTTTRFQIRLPSPERYRGRLLHVLSGGHGGDEFASTARGLPLADSIGAIFVASNQGWNVGRDAIPTDRRVVAFGANVDTTRFAMSLATTLYGTEPAHRYLFGWSGGGNRALNTLEHVDDLYAGAVAGGMTDPPIGRSARSVIASAISELREVAPRLADILDVGGDPADLGVMSAAQRASLESAWAAGFPRGAEWLLARPTAWLHGWMNLSAGDPDYLDDFLHREGYEGHDDTVTPTRIDAVVQKVVSVSSDAVPPFLRSPFGEGPMTALRLALGASDASDLGDLVGSEIRTADAAAEDIGLPFLAYHDGVVLTLPGADLREGARVTIDDSRWLALQKYHRHLAERRRTLVPPSVLPYTGRPSGRIILLQATQDHLALVPFGAAYAAQVADPDRLRIWWMDNADHDAPGTHEARARLVDWSGHAHRALADLVSWVELREPPAESTVAHLDERGILRLAPRAVDRRGVQPVVTLGPSGGRIDARAGETVVLRGEGTTPPGGGEIVEVAWDVRGSGRWEDEEVDPALSVAVATQAVYPEAGVYFAGLRVRSRRPGRDEDPGAVLENLARVRVVIAPRNDEMAGRK